MPSNAKSRSTKRASLNWGPILAFATGLNVAFGLFYSPSTSLRHVKVLGAGSGDTIRIKQLLNRRADVATMQVDPLDVMSAVKTNPEVNRVSYKANCFGQAELKIWLKQPVARIESDDEPQLVLTGDGDVVVSSFILDDLPVLSLPEGSLDPALNIAAGWTSRALSQLAKKVQENKGDLNWVIASDSRGVIALIPSKGAMVILGGPTDLDKKFQAFQDVLKNQPNVLSTCKEINVSAPSRPTLR